MSASTRERKIRDQGQLAAVWPERNLQDARFAGDSTTNVGRSSSPVRNLYLPTIWRGDSAADAVQAARAAERMGAEVSAVRSGMTPASPP
jgi:hypothetical protein